MRRDTLPFSLHPMRALPKGVPHQQPNQPELNPQTSGAAELREINLCRVSPPVSGIMLQ